MEVYYLSAVALSALLSTGTSPLSALAFVASTQIWIQHFSNKSYHPYKLIGAALVGSVAHLALVHWEESALTRSGLTPEAFVATAFASVVGTLLPSLSLLTSAFILRRVQWSTPSAPTSIRYTLPALLFTLAGVFQERTGCGRSFWLIQDAGAVQWMGAWGGPVVVDWVWAVGGIALAEVWRSIHCNAGEAEKTIQGGEEDLLRDMEAESTPPRRSTPALGIDRMGIIALSFVGVAILIGTYAPPTSFIPTHPTQDLQYRYPSVSVGCVVPPSSSGRHGRQPKADSWALSELIRESRVVASMGTKIISWSEAATRIEIDVEKLPKGEGWNGMAEREKDVLRQVASVCDQYKVFIGATYLLVYKATSGPDRILNILTLVGPTSPDSPIPNIIFSTTKNHPVPFIESYSHQERVDPALGSVPHRLPLSRILVPHRPHTPSPNVTPLQSLDITGAVCLDIAYPSLLSSYFVATSSPSSELHSPGLILNPSASPSSLAPHQFLQSQSRAIEHNSFILRCDSGTGISGLVSPDGSVRVVRPAGEGWESWSGTIDVERAKEGTWFGWIGKESLVWVILVLLSLVGVVMEELVDARSDARRERLRDVAGSGWRRVREARERVWGGASSGVGINNEGRLIEVN